MKRKTAKEILAEAFREVAEEKPVDEQEHFDWVRRHLNQMYEIGVENYLIEQLS